MSQQHLNKQDSKVLWFGDLVNPSGFGRIGNEITRRLVGRGWRLIGLSIPWPGYPFHDLPYPIWGTGGQDIWNKLVAMWNAEKPDIVVVCQDYPYAQTAFHGCRIDWSVTKMIIITPIDGEPIHPDWLAVSDLADDTLVISEFGVEAARKAGRRVHHLPVGVDTNAFYPAREGEVMEWRAKVGIAPGAFVVGMFAMNQGRKAISKTVELFTEFCRDKPEALLYLDMEAGSPAGWDIPNLLKQIGLDPARVKYQADAMGAGLTDLRSRYLLCDVTSQLAHREGFGLPNLESMACGLPTLVLDYCSGPELAAGGAVLIKRLAYMEHGTWGGAKDAFPDERDWLRKMERLYDKPGLRQSIGQRSAEWANARTWDRATDNFETVLKTVVENIQKERGNDEPDHKPFYVPAPGLNDRGLSDTPAARLGDHPVLQSPGQAAEVRHFDVVYNEPGSDGNHRPGRLQPELQPDGTPPPAGDQGGPQ